MTRGAPSRDARSGFTLIEALGALLILGLAVTAAMTSFFHVSRQEIAGAAQHHLDMDSRLLIERLRRDLWLTSRDEILLHPEGDGPYTALAFPIVLPRNEADPVPLNPDGSIAWDATVIYHLWDGPPAEVRRTVFSPRADLDEALRIEQIERTVSDGNGAGAPNGNHATTRTMIGNLVDWRLNVEGPRFDGYSQTPGRRAANIGSAVLADDWNDFTFRVKGRNSRSAGFRIGIDWLSASASGSPREAEFQEVTQDSGATPAPEWMGDTWGGQYRLGFPAAGDDASFTLRMENDRWEERRFLDTSALLIEDNVSIRFDTGLTPGAYVLQLTGNDTIWRASEQTGHGGSIGDIDGNLENTAVRVVLRGGDMMEDSGFIGFNGTNVWIRFRNGGLIRQLRIAEAFLAECDPDLPMNIVPDTLRPIRFGGQPDVKIGVVSSVESDPVPFHIRKDRSYAVAFRVAHPGESAPAIWHAWTAASGAPQAYVIRNADSAALHAPSWHGVAMATNAVLAVQSVRAGYAPEGIYRSRIIDTRLETPAYRTIEWAATTPEGSGLEFRVRSGSEPDLSDALDWSMAAAPANGAELHLNGRYVQVQTRMTPGGENANATPVLRDFTIRWAPEPRVVDIGGMFSTGPDHGIFELLVNNRPLVQAVTVDLTVYADIPVGGGLRRRLTASAFAEIVPRNTRRRIEADEDPD